MKNKLKSILTICLLGLTLSLSTTSEVVAQCPMCKMGAESNLKNGGTAGRGLNNGILYMLSMPYLLVAAGAYLWYRSRKREEEEEKFSNQSDDEGGLPVYSAAE